MITPLGSRILFYPKTTSKRVFIAVFGLIMSFFSVKAQPVLLHFPFDGNTNPSTNVLGGSFSIEPVNAGDQPIQNAYVGGMVESNPIYNSPTCGSSGGSALSYSNFHYGDALRFTFNTNAAYTAYKWSFCDYTTNSGESAFGTLITRASYDGGSTWWYFNGGWGVQTGSWTSTPSFSRAWQELPAEFEHRDEVIFEIYKFDDPASSSYVLIVDNFRIFGTPCTHPDRAALIELYEATDGDNWTNTWDTTSCDVCGWYGVGCDGNGRVTSVILNYNNLNGGMVNLSMSFLQYIEMIGNNLTGAIPNFNLQNLSHVNLSENTLTGVIPNFNANNLQDLNLSNNEFSGSIPSFSLPNLVHLNISNNQLTGNIPNLNLPNLQSLVLSTNNLSGTIPNFNLPSLQFLHLASNNLSGQIPSFNFPNLYYMSLANNQLTGSIPNFNFPNLLQLHLQINQLTGSIPSFNLSNLQHLVMYSNQLSGYLPNLNLPNIQTIRFENNNIFGCFPASYSAYCGINYDFSNNPLLPWQGDFSQFCMGSTQIGAPCDNSATVGADEIQADCSCAVPGCTHPDKAALIELYEATDGDNWTNTWDTTSCDVCNWYGVGCDGNGRVICIDMDGNPNCGWDLFPTGNGLTGNLPDLHLTELRSLRLSFNNISGVLLNYVNMPNLIELVCDENQIFGSIPNFTNMPNLRVLWLLRNQLTGTIPNFSNIPQLRYLAVDENQLTGNIPDFSNLPNLIELWCYGNGLTGVLPNFSNIPNLQILQCGSNQITGNIPNFTNLPNLQIFQCHQNQLTGPLPMFNLPNLSNFLAANNNLSGCFPSSYSAYCGIIYNFTNNPLLPWQGDFSQFCAGGTQIGAPCDNTATAGADEIQADCSCDLACAIFNAPLSASTNTICNGESVDLTFDFTSGVGPYTVAWSGGATLTDIDDGHIETVSPTTTRTYTITSVTDANGCPATGPFTPVTVTVVNPVNAGSITGPLNVCQGNTHTYSIAPVAGATSYEWTVPAGAVINTVPATGNSISVSWPAGASSGDVCVTALRSPCTTGGQQCISVNFTPAYSASFTGTTTICNGDNTDITFNTTGGNTPYDVTWSGGATLNNIDDGHPITVSPNATTNYTITAVTDNNGCPAIGPFTPVTVTVQNPPNTNNVTGSVNACEGATTTYTTNPVAGATSYNWTVPVGAVIMGGQGTNSISVNWPDGAESGDVCVTAENGCTPTVERCRNVTFTPIPAAPALINGPTTVCRNTAADFSVDFDADANSYQWTLPPGATIGAGANTDNITVNFNNNAQNGPLCVRAVAANGCGQSNPTCLPLQLVGQPVTPVFVSPPSATPCIGETQTYTVSPQTSVDSYSWDTGGAGDILSGDGTNTITVQWTAAGPAQLTVIANSTLCDDEAVGSRNITVRPTPDAPAEITGAEAVCAGQTVIYTAATVPGATGYTWNVSGLTGFGQVVGPTNTNQLQINWLFDGVVTFSCSAIGACGVGEALEKTVVVENIPLAPTAISGPASVCVGSQAAYSVGNVQNNWSFNWTVPANASILSGQGTPSVTVQFNAAQNGTINVAVSNNCSSPVSRQLVVTASSGSALNAGTISGPTGICPSSNANYTIATVPGATGYQWTVPAGATVVSGQNTTGISVNWGTATGGQVCVSAVGSCGAGSPSCTNVAPIPGLSVNLGNDTTLCPGNTLVLNAGTGAGAYAWSTTATTNTIAVSVTGTYSVTVSAGTGNTCTASDAIMVTVAALNPPSAVTQLSVPATTTNVSVNTPIVWPAPIGCVAGYTINIGTTPGGNQIAGPVNASNNTYQPGSNLPPGTTIYVTIVPNNAAGNGPSATFSFTTAGNVVQNCATTDSLALVAFYWATGGPNWTNDTNWLVPGMSINTWYGITVNQNGCVIKLELQGLPLVGLFTTGNNLTGTLPFATYNLNALEEINLGGNLLTGIVPDSFHLLPNLKKLILHTNNFTGALPKSLGQLNQITDLVLSFNKFSSEIPLEWLKVGSPLRVIRLNHNQLNSPLHPEFSNLQALELLTLSGCSATSIHNTLVYEENVFADTLPASWSTLTQLTTLNIANAKVHGALPAAWSDMVNLKFLDLSCNEIGGVLPASWSSLPFFQLQLRNNQLKSTIPASWSNLPNIRVLELQNNQLFGEGINFTQTPGLFHLELQNNDFDRLPNMIAGSVWENNANNASRLYCEGNKLTFDDILYNIDNNFNYLIQYAPQDSVFHDTTLLRNAGENLVFSLDFDENVTGSVYKWYKNGVFQFDRTDNDLVINNLDPALHAGVWRVQVTNPAAPDLTLFSRAITVQVQGAACPLLDGINYWGTIICTMENSYIRHFGIECTDCTDILSLTSDVGTVVLDPINHTIVDIVDAPYGVPINITFSIYSTNTGETCGPYMHTFEAVSGPTESIISTGGTVICPGETTILSIPAVPSATYTWWRNGVMQPNSNTNQFTTNQAGTYQVTWGLFPAICVSQSIPLTLSEGSAPFPVITANTPCQNGTLTLQDNSGTGVAWSWSGPQGYSSNTNPATRDNMSFATSGTYSVTVTNAEGCTATATIDASTYTIPMTTSFTSPHCLGQVEIEITSMIGAVTYDWSDLPGTNDPEDRSFLPPGSYSLTVTDSGNGCTKTADITFSNLNDIIATADLSPTICSQSNGEIQLNVSGGQAPYSFFWADLSGPGQPQNRTGLTPGTYEVTVSESSSSDCWAILSLEIVEGGGIGVEINSLDFGPTSCGQNTGYINLATNQPPASLTIDWADLPGTSDPLDRSGLAAGTYTVTVTDVDGCSSSTSVVISQIGQPPLLSTTIQPAACGQNTGGVTLTVSGGTAPISFAWSNTSTTQNLTNVPAGTYTVTVQDGAGCTASTTAVVGSSGNVPVLSTSVQPAGCGQNTGGVTLTVSGGTAPFNFAWSNTATTQNLTNVPAGTYTVTVLDGAGCTASTTAVVGSSGNVPVLSTSVQPAGCSQNTGGVTLTVSGGTAPISFAWSNTSTTQNLTNVPAGTYTVTVLDGAGCTASTTAVVGSSGNVPVLSTSVQPASCGQNTGGVTLTVTGGTAPFNFAWSNTSTTQNLTNVPAGTYTVTVLDGAGCTASTTAVVGSSGNIPVLSTSVQPAGCGQNTGGVTLTVSGGTAPFNFAWSNTATTQNLTNVPSGTYTVTVTDGNGCTASISATVGSTGNAPMLLVEGTICTGVPFVYGGNTYTQVGFFNDTIPVPGGCDTIVTIHVVENNPSVEIFAQKNTICPGMSLALVASATNCAACTYTWSTNATTASIEVTQAAAYTVTITSSAGCIGTASLSLSATPAPVVQIVMPQGDTINCDQPDLILQAQGTGNVYQWSGGLGNAATIKVNQPGTYQVTATNAAGCTNTASSTVFLFFEALDIARNDTTALPPETLVTVNVLENDLEISPDTYDFSIVKTPLHCTVTILPDNQLRLAPLNDGYFGPDSLIYQRCDPDCPTRCDEAVLYIELLQGCVPVPSAPIPEALSPNGDGANDIFDPLALFIGGPCEVLPENCQFFVFNRVGECVFAPKSYTSWDGIQENRSLPEGTYYYILTIRTLGNTTTFKSSVFLAK